MFKIKENYELKKLQDLEKDKRFSNNSLLNNILNLLKDYYKQIDYYNKQEHKSKEKNKRDLSSILSETFNDPKKREFKKYFISSLSSIAGFVAPSYSYAFYNLSHLNINKNEIVNYVIIGLSELIFIYSTLKATNLELRENQKKSINPMKISSQIKDNSENIFNENHKRNTNIFKDLKDSASRLMYELGNITLISAGFFSLYNLSHHDYVELLDSIGLGFLGYSIMNLFNKLDINRSEKYLS